MATRKPNGNVTGGVKKVPWIIQRFLTGKLWFLCKLNQLICIFDIWHIILPNPLQCIARGRYPYHKSLGLWLENNLNRVEHKLLGYSQLACIIRNLMHFRRNGTNCKSSRSKRVKNSNIWLFRVNVVQVEGKFERPRVRSSLLTKLRRKFKN